jgi:hypothetical protein
MIVQFLYFNFNIDVVNIHDNIIYLHLYDKNKESGVLIIFNIHT